MAQLGTTTYSLSFSTVVEDMKSNAREFLGKDDYEIGDITKEVDARVKNEVAKLRDKDEYELGDFVLAMDELSKKYTEELTGKPYEPGDLSSHLDTSIKARVAQFCGKETYETGDLTREIASRIERRVNDFTGKEGYEVCSTAPTCSGAIRYLPAMQCLLGMRTVRTV